ncbi:MAG: carbamoyl-phosphate synthase large subunit [Actinomycetia bacterium]|nr:carbamoyl-phosphate synthase large subunit [Actinomycetes bacterium]
MAIERLLVANRAEIAVRIIQAATDLGITTVAIHAQDDGASRHVELADYHVGLSGRGAPAYLDIDQIVTAAAENGCDAVHPGYGFLAENADFARAVETAGLIFVGPKPETLDLFGDKATGLALARRLDVPVLAGTESPTSPEAAGDFLSSLGEGGAVMVKATAGGGGRGMRPVVAPDELEAAMARCHSEAQAAFGNGDLYLERLLPRARHVEVQIVGDGSGTITHLWERGCSVQRQRQKLVEIAPAPGLAPAVRDRLIAAAVAMAGEVSYRSLGTFEFLVDATNPSAEDAEFVFIEANARIQVEHTVTEEITGIDLVAAQLRLAGGSTLADVGLDGDPPAPRGTAVQARVNMETMDVEGHVRPTGGTLTTFEPPAGPSVRTDTFGYSGYTTSPSYDSLLAKVIGHAVDTDPAIALGRTARALAEFRLQGVATNLGLLEAILRRPEVATGEIHTTWLDDNLTDLLAAAPDRSGGASAATEAAATPTAGARLDSADPLGVLDHGREVVPVEEAGTQVETAHVEGTQAVAAPLQGTIISLDVGMGDEVAAGQQVAVMESMKMEHVIQAESSGVVRRIDVAPGDAIFEGHALIHIELGDVSVSADLGDDNIDLDYIRPDLAAVIARHELGLDEHRPQAVAKRRKTGHRTARENLHHLIDDDSWIEYGPLVVAAQRSRRKMQDLIENTPADGMLSGIGSINGSLFDEEKRTQAVVMSYDYTVLAGTQGHFNHYKKDRMMELAIEWRLPVVFFAEGGGGRPGDVDNLSPAGLDILTFNTWGRLSGTVPMVGITTGRCFAGNAVILGCCDVVIATKDSNIGMGGPAMIEGGGLGVYRPEEVGPMEIQVPNGVVDIEVEDEAQAVEVAKKYLSYFQGPIDDWSCADQRELRHVVPENRLRIYDVRQAIEMMFDTDSVLEIRKGFGHGMVTAFARIEGRPVGVIANNPAHLGGAIDSDAADKATRFLQLCDAFDIPIVSLCDTPGNMVGPEHEKEALVRHCCRMFVNAASVTVPFLTVVLRKSYGLGAQGMAAGSFKTPLWAVAWPTGEFGGMGLEGAVKLGFRKELEAIEDIDERIALYDKLVARSYERGAAMSTATFFEIDGVIDPSETRHWILSGLKSASVPFWRDRDAPKRPCVDTW